MFQSRLEIIRSMLQGVSNPAILDGVDKIKYLWKKSGIAGAIKDLQTWQALTDQSWFLFMAIADPEIDSALDTDGSSTLSLIPSASTIRSSLKMGTSLSGAKLMLPHGEVERMEILDIAFSDAKTAKRNHSSGSSACYVLNEISGLQSPPGSQFSRYAIAKEDSGKLASKLQHKNPEKFRLLTCKGFTLSGTKADPKITLILRAPPDLSPHPRSLRSLLLGTGFPDSLTQQLDIAKELANAVGYVHVFGFVHKNIRPESILCFSRPDGTFTSTFLVGFELFRRDMGWTQRLGDTAPDKNLYRHPSRQGINPAWNYTMQHDIYSLGVCLLEIGLWKSFVNYGPTSNEKTFLVPQVLGFPAGISDLQLAKSLAAEGKERLVSLAQKELPRHMGTKYSEVVITCLKFMDEEDAEISKDVKSENGQGILVGIHYIEKVSAYSHFGLL